MILAIFFILFLGSALRISSIFHHLPEFPHVDEKIILRIISTFRISDLTHPADFIYPDLVDYILWPIIFFYDLFFSSYLTGANILMDGISEDVSFIFDKIEQHPYRLEIIKWERRIDYPKFFDASKFDFIVIRDAKDRPAYIEPLYDFINKNFLMVKEFKPVIAKPESNFIYLEIYDPKIRIYNASRKMN